MNLLEDLKRRLVNNIDLSRDLSDEELMRIITQMVTENLNGKSISAGERIKAVKELFNSIRGLDVLQEILEDDTVTEIMVNGPDNIFIEREGRLYKFEGKFSSKEKLLDVIQSMIGQANKRVNEATPIVDSRLPDGSRVNVVLSPVAIDGPVVTIRKFPKTALTIEDLIRMGSITQEAALFLKKLVEAGYNIFISGGTGSGKTTFLNVLSNFIPPGERIITIEDSAELRIEGIENLVSLECRQANVEGENEITIRDLIKTSLRMRPNRIVVGEVRSAEALDMLQAMNTGHDGSLSTGHANSPRDMLTRLETMVLMGTDMPIDAIRAQIASAIEILVHLGRSRDGMRRVLEISEIVGYKDGEIRLEQLFVFDGEGLWPTGARLHNRFKLEESEKKGDEE